MPSVPPVDEPGARVDPAKTPLTPEHRQEPPHLLLVDDYPDSLEIATMFLETAGFRVTTSSTGADALASARRDPPDVSVIDLQLPDLPGVELAQRLLADPVTAHTTLIALTGRTRSEDHDEARAAGFSTVLVKPCDPPALVAAIRAALDARRPADRP